MPDVTVIVACRNEEQHIEACVRSISRQEEPPGNFEIIVLDGMSEDGTRDILARLAHEDSRIRMMDNPRRIKPYALNVGIQSARGRYIAVLDAHTEYAHDYLRVCVELLEEHPEVCCVGGPILSRGRHLFGKAVAMAMSHPVGIGNAKHRIPHYEGYAEGACFPMFRREVFEKVGVYDEILTRNQDDEFNYRLARAGEKVFISPRAQCTYFVRETASQLFRQYFQYGFWRVAVLRKHRLPASLRQIVPPLFMSSMLLFTFLGLVLPGWWRLIAVALPVSYAAILLIAGVKQGAKGQWRVAFMFPIAIAIMHAAYAAGFMRGIFKNPYLAEQSVSHKRGEFHESRT
jgi:glycosyltransferase involved in cell wall biosynthesis